MSDDGSFYCAEQNPKLVYRNPMKSGNMLTMGFLVCTVHDHVDASHVARLLNLGQAKELADHAPAPFTRYTIDLEHRLPLEAQARVLQQIHEYTAALLEQLGTRCNAHAEVIG